jgi:hypothetical protein
MGYQVEQVFASVYWVFSLAWALGFICSPADIAVAVAVVVSSGVLYSLWPNQILNRIIYKLIKSRLLLKPTI